MAFMRKHPVVTVSVSSPTATTNTDTASESSISSQPKQQTSLSSSSSSCSLSFLKRKPVNPASSVLIVASSELNSAIKTTSTFTPLDQQPMSNIVGLSLPPTIQTDVVYSQTQKTLPPTDVAGMATGMAMNANILDTPKTPKTFQQSQDELFSKLEALAAVKNKANPLESEKQTHSSTRVGGSNENGSSRGGSSQQMNSKHHSIYNKSNNGFAYHSGSSVASVTMVSCRYPAESQILLRDNVGGTQNSSSSSRPREPRKRVNSAQFKTPGAADMAELAQVVVANATPPKTQVKLRKRASTLSLTTTTFVSPGNQNPSIMVTTPGGGLSNDRQRYEAACKAAKHWEKKYSATQQQIHYERERWEEKYGALEKTLRDLENNKTEANVEKMNLLLDTVQQLQIANETFRKQLMDAGIEPDPSPAAQFHSHHLLVGQDQDRTFTEENERMKEQSLVANKKISHLSTEINNSAIAISQTINYVQLRYLIQMLDVAEHVTSQKRARVMSNSFLSDILSRGVNKTDVLQPNNTCTAATQTPPAILTALQLQQQEHFQQQFMQQQLLAATNGVSTFKFPEKKLAKSFSLSSSLFGLSGFHNGTNRSGSTEGKGHHNNVSKQIHYRLKGAAFDNRSQLDRQGIPLVVFKDLKGSPMSPDSTDLLAASRGPTPLPKFQYASPISSQLRVFVPHEVPPHGYRTLSRGSQVSGTEGSVLTNRGTDELLKRSSSEISLRQLQ